MIHLLCGTTAEAGAGREARWADEIAHLLHGELELVNAGIRRSAEESPETAHEVSEETGVVLARWATARHIDDATLLATEHPPDAALTDEAGANDAFAVVIGSAPYEGVTSLGLGSLAHRLAHELSCPLIVVPPGQYPLAAGTVVIGVDGSSGSEQALRWGSWLADRIGGEAVAVFAIDAMYETFQPRGFFGRAERAARRQIRVLTPGLELIERSASEPAEALHDVAAQRDAALVVVAARDHHSLGGMLLGRVPDAMLHHPVRPVAVIPHGYEFVARRAARFTSVADGQWS
jgi:nucleotide-binding universal stress UspA family protein